jgi:ribosomal protein L4
MVAVLKEVGISGKKALFITASPEMNLVKAGGNIKGITVTFTGELNAYQVVNADTLLITNGALPAIEELCKK